MRLPFLQVSQEEMARARTLAGYLGVSYAHALGMTVALKAAALEAAPEGDVSGVIRDPNPAEWMAVQCGWPIDRADVLASALVRCGFAMAGPQGGHTVASMEPYARALETSGKRSEAGRRGAEARKSRGGYGRAMAEPQPSNGHGMARDAKTQTQTQKKEEKPSAVAPATPGVLVHVEPTKPQPKPKKQPDGEHHALWRALEAEYQRVMGHPYASGNGGQDATAVKWFRETAPPEEAVRRWGALLEWSKGGFPSVTGFASLRQHWNAPQVAGAPSRQRAEAQVGRGAEGVRECAACGEEGGGCGWGDPPVWLGYRCGCGGRFQRAMQDNGLTFRDAAAWARERRAGRAA
jgi:hypothetical protein